MLVTNRRGNRWVRAALSLAAFGVAAIGGAIEGKALEPGEIVILYNAMSPRSLEVAKYYANARHIPVANIVPLRCGPSDWIPETDYRRTVLPDLKKGLADHQLTDKVKCFVTTYGLPLGISAWSAGLSARQETVSYQKQLNVVMDALEGQIREYDALGTMAAAPATQATTNSAKPKGVKQDLNSLLVRLSNASRNAVTRVRVMAPADQAKESAKLVAILQRTSGIAGLITSLRSNDRSANADPAQDQIDKLQVQLTELNKQYLGLLKDQDDPDTRQKLVTLQAQSHGLIGEAYQLQSNLTLLMPLDTESSFDNELALALATNESYPRSRWIQNPMNLEFYPNLVRMKDVTRTVMVTRLDGATPQKTMEMIDLTLTTEAKGLDGTCYFDARGMHDAGPYAMFDADLRRATEWLQANSTMPVVLDDKPGLMQAKDCPNAALYCGWYSLKHYVDSCQWVQGAVGYHVASLEMTSLHNPKETGWVVNLLDRGFCGTLGAVSEPYLTSFPKPSLFFPLLLSGQFTQGEVWQMTAPMLSWRTAYVGDPLYNPFKVKPRVTVEALKKDAVLANAFLELPRK